MKYAARPLGLVIDTTLPYADCRPCSSASVSGSIPSATGCSGPGGLRVSDVDRFMVGERLSGMDVPGWRNLTLTGSSSILQTHAPISQMAAGRQVHARFIRRSAKCLE